MNMGADGTFTAFHGTRRLHTAPLRDLLAHLKAREADLDLDPGAPLLIFDDQSGRPVDVDLRGSVDDVIARVLPDPKPVGRGRPKLGVVAREVTLLPRHWEWLEAQPGGASAALRRLVDEARKRHPERELARAAQAAADRFLQVLAGDLPGYQEASRALYARDASAFDEHAAAWPPDVRDHARRLAAPAFAAVPPEPATAL